MRVQWKREDGPPPNEAERGRDARAAVGIWAQGVPGIDARRARTMTRNHPHGGAAARALIVTSCPGLAGLPSRWQVHGSGPGAGSARLLHVFSTSSPATTFEGPALIPVPACLCPARRIERRFDNVRRRTGGDRERARPQEAPSLCRHREVEAVMHLNPFTACMNVAPTPLMG